MKPIFVVHFDWAFNGGSSEGYVGIYENREDAVKRMEQYWEDEKAMEYFKEFDQTECTEMVKEAWTDGYYMGEHSCVKVYEEYLFSHEDVINGLDN